MTFRQAVISALYYYATFQGRASRSALWYFVLFCFLCSLIAGMLDFALFHQKMVAANGAVLFTTPQRFGWLPTVLFFIPNLSLTVRRLHDTDHSGWWVLLNMVPYALVVGTGNPLWGLVALITSILMLVFLCSRGTRGDNRFGPDPLEHSIST